MMRCTRLTDGSMIHPNAPDTKAGQLTVRTVFVIAPDRTLVRSPIATLGQCESDNSCRR